MNKLMIGSANFGVKYGFKNQHKQLNFDAVSNILDFAWKNNIDFIDTAMGYGNSESVIGNYLGNNLQKDFIIVTKINKVENSYLHLKESLGRLKKENVYGVLVHNFNYYEESHSIYDNILRFKDEGYCKKVGFSLYYPEELLYLIEKKIQFDIVQIAYSVFDRRFEKYFPILKELNVEIHVRSVFLQGLFFLNTSGLSSHFDRVKPKIEKIQQLSQTSGISIASICLNFVSHNDNITKIIIGVDNVEDLQDNINVSQEKERLKPYIGFLQELEEQDVNILFPHFWK
ncbi:MAG: hypothetical protein A2275_07315 [Bacteroidetes bacterium RIFOXYA12_FULL_35_11]|nr:MAG: hypothetical protein A2X01_06405 [Bacteroidetes bacterium GWF2_35_48]OFY73058.1 MAG: hypothetical protein A2275_07315 [Bacteroidetes bacterium RIFOXYA12_FULL_35_11]OFY93946.1 MAG: hypothetical protein A2491_11890 [Bacteroidetes bacterium RIFOXYC12_FULL_35_7]OFY97845.1 MAG: hypothetical protein A2309_01540 [Bacteroidetes bacterium RIFOXYB2_FULL_35_7]HBX53545.1 hypothetical protein [Bacteroidales bacterium]